MAAAGKSRRPAREKAKPRTTVTNDSRGQLIDATLRIVLDKGIDAVRIDEIVAEVGVTKGSLYWHFDDREALIKAAIAEHIRRLNAETISAVSEAIASASGKDDYFARIAPYIANPYDKKQVLDRWRRLAILVETRNDPELSEMMKDLQSRNLSVFVELMTEAQDAGVLRRDLDPRAVAVALNAMNLGSNIVDVLGENGPDESAWWALMAFFVGALFPPDAGEVSTP